MEHAQEPRAPAHEKKHELQAMTHQQKSKAFVMLSILLILIGWCSWNAWDYFGTQGLNPKEIKKMASAYERECYAIFADARGCKRHIGTWHRTCLPQGVDRTQPGEAPRPVRYTPDGYIKCMRQKRMDAVGK